MFDFRARSPSPALTLFATSLGFVIVILDVTVVNVAVERIRDSLRTDITGLQWVLNAYTLVFASLLLTGGALGDRLGARRVFVAGFALFTAASLACGLAGNVAVLIAGRVAQGVGAALCVPASLALLNASYAQQQARARAVSIWAGVGGLAIAAGPVVGGIMVDSFGWPSIFFLNLPLGLIGIWLTLAHAPEGTRNAARGLDLTGQALAVLALGGITLACIESGALGWHHPLVLAGLGGGVLATLAFIFTEGRSAAPMLPLALFRAPAVGLSCLIGLLINFAFYGLMFVFSLFFQSVKGYTPLVTGLAFLPMTALVSLTNLASARLAARYGARLPIVLGQALAAAGYFTLTAIGAHTSYTLIMVPLLAAGVGTALVVPAITSAVLEGANDARGGARAGVASGLLNAARQTGAVMGVGVFGSLVAAKAGGLAGGMPVALALAGLALLAGCLAGAFGLPSRIPPERCAAAAR